MKQKSDFVSLNQTQVDVKSFDCGKEPINRYLHRFAAKNMGLKLSSTFVLPYRADNDPADTKLRIAAFYTLANQSLAPETTPTGKKLPRYEAPVVLVAQLGVDLAHQGKGLGSKTIINALQHAYNISSHPNGIPSLGVIMDAIDEQAPEFYLSFEFFLQFEGAPSKLFIPMESFEELLRIAR